MGDDILDDLIGHSQPAAKPVVDSYFEKYGFDQNPFPPNRMIIPEVLYGQKEAYMHFASAARDIIAATEPQRRAIGLIAGTGGGKTHFLRHAQLRFRQASKKRHQRFAIVEFVAGSGKILDLLREIYRGCDEALREDNEQDFVTAIVGALNETADANGLLASVRMDELREALNRALKSYRQTSSKPTSTTVASYEMLRGILRRWLFAESLTQAEKRAIGSLSRLGTAASAMRVFRDMLNLARELNVLDGVFLAIDEMESLFNKGLSQAQIQAFLQDLRFLYDDAVREDDGYSLLLMSASTTTGASALQKNNYPIYQRLGYEGPNQVLLNFVEGVSGALDFARAYIDHFHNEWKQNRKNSKLILSPQDLLTTKEIEAAFREVAVGDSAPQGPLLDRLHRKVNEKRDAVQKSA